MTAPRVITGLCAMCGVKAMVVETGRAFLPARRTCLACVEVCVDMVHDRLAGALLAEQERVRDAA